MADMEGGFLNGLVWEVELYKFVGFGVILFWKNFRNINKKVGI